MEVIVDLCIVPIDSEFYKLVLLSESVLIFL